MIEWSETHVQIRDMIRKFVDAEIRPHREALEHGDLPPYDLLRKMIRTFGMKDMAEARFAADLAKEKERAARGEPPREKRGPRPGPEAGMEAL